MSNSKCFVCEFNQGLDHRDFKEPICETCIKSHELHLQRHELGKRLNVVRARFLDSLTWKQFLEYHPTGKGKQDVCPSRKAGVVSLFTELKQLELENRRLYDAIAELDKSVALTA